MNPTGTPLSDKPNLSYAVIGTGAVGGFYGSKLANAGKDVHFLFHSDAAHVKKHGLFVESPQGDIRLSQVAAYGHVEEMPQCDVVCVCLKTTQNKLLTDLLPPVVKPGGIVLVMQNGLGVEEDVAAILPDTNVAGVICYICSNKVGPGHVTHLYAGHVALAAHSEGIENLLARIAEDFRESGIAAEVYEDLQLARWRKLVWNIPYNGLTVVLDTTTAEIMACPPTHDLCESLMEEVVTAGEACGHAVGREHMTLMLSLTAKMPPYAPSMKLDYEAGRPMEIEYMYQRPIERAREAGAPMPRVETITAMLRFLDRSNRQPV